MAEERSNEFHNVVPLQIRFTPADPGAGADLEPVSVLREDFDVGALFDLK